MKVTIDFEMGDEKIISDILKEKIEKSITKINQSVFDNAIKNMFDCWLDGDIFREDIETEVSQAIKKILREKLK